jgi:hypothetical protein
MAAPVPEIVDTPHISLLTNILVDEAPQVIRTKSWDNDTLAEWTVLQVKFIIELQEFSVSTT